MKLKRWVVWLLVVAFLASEVFLFSANRQKDAAHVALLAEKQRADDLQAQLDQIQSSNAVLQSAELSRLRAENQDLPRLRNRVTQLQTAYQKLQAAYQKLYQQLDTTLTAAQQQQDQLQQLATENQQAQAAARQAQAVVARNSCINNLRQIDAAKQQWALENGKTAYAVPTAQDLLPYFKDGIFPVCPSGGTYTIGAVGEVPGCSIPGHVLPQ